MSLVTIGLVAAATTLAAPTIQSSKCALPGSEAKAQLAHEYSVFDGQDGPYGWRTLNARGCTDAAVSLIAYYTAANAPRLTPDQLREMAFHAAQALMMANRQRESLPFLAQADSVEASPEWRAYVAAHRAWATRSKSALQAARKAYRAAPHASAMRLAIIEGFIACPDQAYMVSAMCNSKAHQ